MKYAKILRIFTTAIILSLLTVAILVTPAQAARGIELDPEEGKVGDEITIAGWGFNKSIGDTDKYATIYFSSDEASTVHDIDDEVTTYEKLKTGVWLDEEGNFETTFDVPDELNDGDDDEDVVAGTYYVYVCHYGYNRIRAVAEFTVIGGEIALDPDEGPVDAEVEITGTDFATREDIIIEYDGDEVDIEDGDDDTDRDGEFFSVIFIPESTAGSHTIAVTVSGSEVEAEFTVEPDIVLNLTSGEVGDEITVSGTGFSKRKEVTIWFHNVGVATTRSGREGSFDTTFNVPELEAGIYDVEAEDEDENLDGAKFTVTVPPPPPPAPTPPPQPPSPPPPSTTASLSLDTGHIGGDLLMSGTGFEAGGTVTIRYDDEAIATAPADANGLFVFAFRVPVSKHGDHTITASDGTNTEKLTFSVESKVPKAPTPLLPAMGVEVKSPISFDWEDVTDDSPPVTYTLEIAADNDFDAASMVLEKKELTKSEYTLTKKEKLRLGTKETPYYWRIRALDAASNEGEWADVRKFYIAAPFTIPSWALYTLIGLGGLFLFGLGYWLGRRTALYY